jgi:hypothetical protein
MPKRTVEFEDVECTVETDNAILVEIEGEEHWIPKSQIDDASEVYGRGHEGTLIVTEWIATQKGLV